MPNVNPDGSEFDIATGRLRELAQEPPAHRGNAVHRHRPQPQLGLAVGLLRRLDARVAGETFRGLSAFSAPETRRCATSCSRAAIGGVQQIKVGIDFHTYGELVMWPFAYTYDDTAPGLALDQLDAFSAIGRSLAQSNGFTPQQASDLYISDGNSRDWLWGAEGIFAYGFELYPEAGSGGFYPPDEVIAAQTSRNREAVAAAARDRRLPVPRDRPGARVLRHRHAASLRRRRPARRARSRHRLHRRRSRRRMTARSATTASWRRPPSRSRAPA